MNVISEGKEYDRLIALENLEYDWSAIYLLIRYVDKFRSNFSVFSHNVVHIDDLQIKRMRSKRINQRDGG